MDMKTAFLHGDIKEEIYMTTPPDTRNDGKVCKHRKAIYGLKQASRCWYLKPHEMLHGEGFHFSIVEPSVCTNHDADVLLALYVDDIIIFSSSKGQLKSTKEALTKHFFITDAGSIGYFLWLGNKLQSRTEEAQLVPERVCKIHVGEDPDERANAVDTPMELGDISNPPTEDLQTNVPFQSLLGSLMYAAVCTRPDISMAIGRLSRHLRQPSIRHLRQPSMAHWNAAKRVLRYLNGTKERLDISGRRHDLIVL
ncbi:hypothetical protein L7F22_004623 [Adiantum nelumboides]|nr:hypothetical protein [Adiantum nelumboides]